MKNECECGNGTLEQIAETAPLSNTTNNLMRKTSYHACSSCNRIYNRYWISWGEYFRKEIISSYLPYTGELTRQEIIGNAPKCLGEITRRIEGKIIRSRAK